MFSPEIFQGCDGWHGNAGADRYGGWHLIKTLSNKPVKQHPIEDDHNTSSFLVMRLIK